MARPMRLMAGPVIRSRPSLLGEEGGCLKRAGCRPGPRPWMKGAGTLCCPVLSRPCAAHSPYAGPPPSPVSRLEARASHTRRGRRTRTRGEGRADQPGGPLQALCGRWLERHSGCHRATLRALKTKNPAAAAALEAKRAAKRQALFVSTHKHLTSIPLPSLPRQVPPAQIA